MLWCSEVIRAFQQFSGFFTDGLLRQAASVLPE